MLHTNTKFNSAYLHVIFRNRIDHHDTLNYDIVIMESANNGAGTHVPKAIRLLFTLDLLERS